MYSHISVAICFAIMDIMSSTHVAINLIISLRDVFPYTHALCITMISNEYYNNSVNSYTSE